MDFSKLSKSKSSGMPQKLTELFNQLDRKATHESLRPVQIEALNALDLQINEKDVVLKVSTGSGKTVVGLVYGEYMRRKYQGEIVLYLAPTNQLVDQVFQTGQLIGVNVDCFPKEGRPHHALEGKTILACTYDRLFNSRNTFANGSFVPSTIILDDVHSGIDRVRSTYTATLPAKAYQRIREIFEPLCEATDSAIWRGIANNEPDARYEVPFWIWGPQSATVGSILEPLKMEKELLFCWGNISRYLEHARLCITGTTAELSLSVSASEENLAFAGAKHRLFMSASIKDGAGLIRDLDCDSKALTRIIEPPSDRGAGERMILPVSLIDSKLKKSNIAELGALVSKVANVVVLSSSSNQANVWETFGATVKQGNDVEGAVSELRSNSKGQFVVFTQRFDGIDLPDDACRLLIVDGTPAGERLCDQIDAARQRNSPGYNARIVNRFEQALGRAVRSSADYAAILLVGTDIASFVGKRDVKDLLESHTREQIELGKDLADQLTHADEDNKLKAIGHAINALLTRDEDWKDAHRDRVASVQRTTRNGAELTVSERSAVAERHAWLQAKSRNPQAAVSCLQVLIDDPALHPIQKAELIFRMAGYMNSFDQGKAAALYRGAFQINNMLPRPLQLPDRRYSRVREQSVNLRDGLQAYVSANAAIAQIEEVRSKLAFSGDSEVVEQGLFELGEMLGATSSRPEKETGRGPDVLWIFDDVALCIEAKNEKIRPIFKGDAEQLLLSLKWCEQKVEEVGKDKIVSVFATNVMEADRLEDVSFGPKFMTEEIALSIVDALQELINGISYDGPLFNDTVQINKRLVECHLTGKDIVLRLKNIK